MVKHWNIVLIMTVALVVGLPMLNAQSAETNSISTVTEQDDSVRRILMSLESAIAAKNVEQATALFSQNILFIDQAGEEIRGREGLRRRFDQHFKKLTASKVGIHPQSITFPADNVALVVGEVSHKHEQQDSPVSRFSMVMVRNNNSWLINEFTETAMQSALTENQLQPLSWLIGQWTADRPDASARLNVEWTPNKKFITSKFTLTRPGMAPEFDMQMIGWDPQHRTIVSWHFDNNGGFGNGTWSKQPNEDKWTLDVVGVGADGSNTTASNVFTLKTPDEYVWQSVHRSLDGVAVADTEPIIVHRVKQ